VKKIAFWPQVQALSTNFQKQWSHGRRAEGRSAEASAEDGANHSREGTENGDRKSSPLITSAVLFFAREREVLEHGAKLVRPGGRLAYVTAPRTRTGFRSRLIELWLAAIGTPAPNSADDKSGSLLPTPARHATDGFFMNVMTRASG